MAENEIATAEPAAPENPLRALGVAIAAAAGGAVHEVQLARGGAELVLHARRDALPALMALLRDDPRFAFEQCVDICGVDWPERAERFEVVYNLLSLAHNHRARVIVSTDAATPVPSVAAIWASATWYERETWDMYGVVFAGLADHRRLLTDYGFEGHPLRKDFPLTGFVELRYDEELKRVAYSPVQLAQEFRDFDFMSPWEAMTTLPGDEKVHLNRLEGPK
ncbi:NADH-quinone oxidoreductase subunit C [Roseomonas sp. HF4]|uniref:NADH-quinone oxidoreductase subunit C n=1 Tax=Roseomonas sp. HF4 TaxID=2562313 RepID=UPI002107765E|nr:NADH-quinone oxidoreductase subunit C [Roseomonas sp. HF4]